MTEPKVLWQQLEQAGLVTGAQPPLADRNPQPAFFLRMLLGVCGWLSALFFCGFISAVFVSFLSNSQNIWGLGIILCIVSVWISRLDNIPLFLEQFVFACSLTGQAFIVFGVWESSGSNPVTCNLYAGARINAVCLDGHSQSACHGGISRRRRFTLVVRAACMALCPSGTQRGCRLVVAQALKHLYKQRLSAASQHWFNASVMGHDLCCTAR